MNNLWANIFKEKKTQGNSAQDILMKVPLFENLSRREINRTEQLLHRREYQQNEVIFSQGDPGLGMYIILGGTVEIVSEPSREVLARLEEGDFFGELALLDESPRSATAIAVTPCRMLCFFHPDLLDLIRRDPGLGVKILFRLAGVIGERLRKTDLSISKGQKE
jgi:CRP/FNR family cyclic AMP-dependent transcriptional regulator